MKLLIGGALTVLVIAGLSAVGLLFFGHTSTGGNSPDPDGAVLELGGESFDLGDVPADETVERVVPFTNPGGKPLSVEVVKVRPAPDAACGCGVEGYEVRPGDVPPGGSGELVFKLRVPSGMADMEDVMIAELRTNDPARLSTKIRLVFRMASEENGG